MILNHADLKMPVLTCGRCSESITGRISCVSSWEMLRLFECQITQTEVNHTNT